MSATRRDYRVRIADPGAAEVEGNVDITLGLDVLAGIPVITTQITDVLSGRTQSRPWIVHALDSAGAITAALTADARWRAAGRLIELQSQDLPSGDWTTLGTGRVSTLEEGGPGRYRIECSDESWRARKSRIFEQAATTQIWPRGIRGAWRGIRRVVFNGGIDISRGTAYPALGVRVTPDIGAPTRWRIDMTRTGSVGWNDGRLVTDKVVQWIESDQLAEADKQTGEWRRFRHLRCNYAGTDYEIEGFAVDGDQFGDPLGTLRAPRVTTSNGSESITIRCWIHSESAPPSSGEAFLYAPTAPPSTALPLHIACDLDGFDWRGDDGFLNIGEISRQFFELTDQRYNNASVEAIEDDTSLVMVAPLVTTVPSNPDAWMADNAWGPNLIVVLTDNQGRRKLVNLRIPLGLDPDLLPVLDSSNARPGGWRLAGSETINSIIYEYLSFKGTIPSRAEETEIDNLIPQTNDTAPFEDDTLEDAGRRELRVNLHAAMEPTTVEARRRAALRRGSLFSDVVPVLADELLGIFRDGAFRWRGEVGASVATSLEEGDLVILDAESLKLPNPESGTRAGLRLVRVLSIARHPTHAEIECLDCGPSVQPPDAPEITSIVQRVDDPRFIDVTLDVAAGTKGVLEIGWSATTDPPAAWPIKSANLDDGTSSFGFPKAEGYAHVRAYAVSADKRSRSLSVSDHVALTARPQIESVTGSGDRTGVTIEGTANYPETAGVRIHYIAHDGDEGEFPPATHVDVEVNTDGSFAHTFIAELTAGLFNAWVEPFSEFSAGSVDGDAGEVVDLPPISTPAPEIPDWEQTGEVVPQIGSFVLGLSGDDYVVSWPAISIATVGIRLWYDIKKADTAPDLSDTFVDVEASDGNSTFDMSALITALALGAGSYRITVQGEPYTGFAGSSVTGKAGPRTAAESRTFVIAGATRAPGGIIEEQSAQPSQNLGPSNSGAERSQTTGAFALLGTGTGALAYPLASLGIEVGDTISWAAEFHSGAGDATGQVWLSFYDAANAAVGTTIASTTVDSLTYARSVREAVVVPATATKVYVRGQPTYNGDTLFMRRFMLNRGPIALPFVEPPFRSQRETFTDIAGQIVTDQIAAKAATAEKLAELSVLASKLAAAGIGAALNDDPRMIDLDAWTSSTTATGTNPLPTAPPATWSVEDVSGAPVGTKVLQVVSTTAASRMFSTKKRIPIDPTRTYKVSVHARQPTGTANNYLLVMFVDAAGNVIAGSGSGATGWTSIGAYFYWQVANAAFPTAWTKYEHTFGPKGTASIPAGAVECRIGALVTRDNPNTTTQFQDYRLELQSGATLIEDDAITTAKIFAGAVTAEKITVSELDAISADLGVIVAGILHSSDPSGEPVAGIRLNSAYSVHPDWLRYIDLAGTGTDPFIHHELFDLLHDGSALYKGDLTLDAGNKIQFDDGGFYAHIKAASKTLTYQGGPPFAVAGSLYVGLDLSGSDDGLHVYSDGTDNHFRAELDRIELGGILTGLQNLTSGDYDDLEIGVDTNVDGNVTAASFFKSP